jgi:hypothetical protein
MSYVIPYKIFFMIELNQSWIGYGQEILIKRF